MNKTMKWIALAGLSVITSVSFVACKGVPADIKEAEERLEKAGYMVDVFEDDFNGYKITVLEAENDDDQFMEAYLFESEKAAKEFYKEFEDIIVVGKEFAYERVDVFEQEDKWVYWGSEDIVNAFLGKK